VPLGVAATYDLTVGVRLDMEDFIYTLTPVDVPLLGTYNGTTTPIGPARSALPTDRPATAKKVEWMDEELLTPRTTLAATLTTADTVLTVASGARLRFATGDIIRVDAEVIRISGYGTTADTLLITRAFGGSDAQHSNAAQVVGVGSAAAEGSDPSAHRFQDRVARYNMTEIFGPWEVKVSESEEAVASAGGKYGLASEFDHQVANRLKEISIAIEQALIYGVRVEDTTNEWRAMGGTLYFITTNVDATTTNAISYSAIRTQMQASYNAGGMVDLLIVPPAQKVKISDFDSTLVNIDRTDSQRGAVVGELLTDFGLARIMVNRHLRTSDLIGLDSQYVSKVPFRPLSFEMLARTGDARKGMCVCEMSMKVRLETRHFRFSTLT
jgi:hypothetical protein